MTSSAVLVVACKLNPKRAKSAEGSILYVSSHNWEPSFFQLFGLWGENPAERDRSSLQLSEQERKSRS